MFMITSCSDHVLSEEITHDYFISVLKETSLNLIATSLKLVWIVEIK